MRPICAEIDLEMKAEAVALCDASESGPTRPWKKNKGLMTFLRIALNARRSVVDDLFIPVLDGGLHHRLNITHRTTYAGQGVRVG